MKPTQAAFHVWSLQVTVEVTTDGRTSMFFLFFFYVLTLGSDL